VPQTHEYSIHCYRLRVIMKYRYNTECVVTIRGGGRRQIGVSRRLLVSHVKDIVFPLYVILSAAASLVAYRCLWRYNTLYAAGYWCRQR